MGCLDKIILIKDRNYNKKSNYLYFKVQVRCIGLNNNNLN